MRSARVTSLPIQRSGSRHPAYEKRRARLDGEGHRRLEDALTVAERGGGAWQPILAIRTIALTGCRRGEIANLRKSELDLTGQALRLTDTKTGASVRPIGKAALAVLRDAMDRSDGLYVFPGARDAAKPFGGLPKAWERMVGPALPGVTAHTLRHSFASVADDLGYTEATIGALLGHSSGGVTRGYIHKLDPALIAAADKIAAHIEAAMSGQLTSADIVEIAAARVSA